MQMSHWGQREDISAQDTALSQTPLFSTQGCSLVLSSNILAPHTAVADFISSTCQEPGTLLECPHQQLGSMRDLNPLSLKSFKCLAGVRYAYTASFLKAVHQPFSNTCSPTAINLSSFSFEYKHKNILLLMIPTLGSQEINKQ